METRATAARVIGWINQANNIRGRTMEARHNEALVRPVRRSKHDQRTARLVPEPRSANLAVSPVRP
jgi:hypothetical protein